MMNGASPVNPSELASGNLHEPCHDGEALALIETREQHLRLLSTLPGVVYRCEPGSQRLMTFMSEKVAKLTGFGATAFESGKSWSDVVHPNDLGRVARSIARALQARRSFRLVYRIVDRAGNARWVRDQGQGVYEGETCSRIEGFIEDITEQKLLELSVRDAEAKAKQKAEHLASVLESTSDCVYSLDRAWRITYLNGRAQAYFGKGGDLVGKSIVEVFPDGRHSEFRACFKAAMDDRVATSTEGFLPSRGCWYAIQVTPTESGITVFFKDISERKLLEETQRAASERWRATLDVIPQMVWSMPAGAAEPDFYNDRWYEFTGLPSGSCAGAGADSLIHPEDQQPTLALWRHCRSTGEPYEARYRIRHQSGEYRWIVSRGRLETNDVGEHVRWYGTCTDIHDRVLQQQELEQSERRVQHILNSVPQIIWSSGPDGRLDFVSKQWAGSYHGTSDKVLGAGWLNVVHKDDQAAALARWLSSLASGEPYEAEFRIRRASGDYSWTLVRALPERDELGRITRWYGTCTDIHERVLALTGASRE
jgi:PAS domain S-box-containing protein